MPLYVVYTSIPSIPYTIHTPPQITCTHAHTIHMHIPYTPPQIAVARGHLCAVEALLSSGANPRQGRTTSTLTPTLNPNPDPDPNPDPNPNPNPNP